MLNYTSFGWVFNSKIFIRNFETVLSSWKFTKAKRGYLPDPICIFQLTTYQRSCPGTTGSTGEVGHCPWGSAPGPGSVLVPALSFPSRVRFSVDLNSPEWLHHVNDYRRAFIPGVVFLQDRHRSQLYVLNGDSVKWQNINHRPIIKLHPSQPPFAPAAPASSPSAFLNWPKLLTGFFPSAWEGYLLNSERRLKVQKSPTTSHQEVWLTPSDIPLLAAVWRLLIIPHKSRWPAPAPLHPSTPRTRPLTMVMPSPSSSAPCFGKPLLVTSNLSKIFNEYLKWVPTFSLPPGKQGGKHMGNMQLVLQNNNEASGNFSRKRNESWGDILQNLEAYMEWSAAIQHVSKHTQSPSTAWGKIFGIFIVNLWQAHHGYLLTLAGTGSSHAPCSQARHQPCLELHREGSGQSCRQNPTSVVASANTSNANGLFPARGNRPILKFWYFSPKIEKKKKYLCLKSCSLPCCEE